LTSREKEIQTRKQRRNTEEEKEQQTQLWAKPFLFPQMFY
jgi:hypothetical protein